MDDYKLLYFTATWCGPCKIFGPIMEEVNKDFVEVKKIDIEEDAVGTSLYGVMSVPTVVLVDTNKGNEISRIIGARTKDMVIDWVRKQVNG